MLGNMSRIISPSVLSADFLHLGRDTEMLNRSEAEWIHIDVMDGVFVPNLSFGFPVLSAIRKVTTKVLDTLLMIVAPDRYIERFAKAGADIIETDYPSEFIGLPWSRDAIHALQDAAMRSHRTNLK